LAQVSARRALVGQAPLVDRGTPGGNLSRPAKNRATCSWSRGVMVAAWFVLVENRYEDVIEAADIGLQIKPTGSVGVQLLLQKAKGYARLADVRETNRAMAQAFSVLAKLPLPQQPDHHFVFDRSKWTHYAATIYTWLGDDQKAKEPALEVRGRSRAERWKFSH
jgi:hypothetical protein